MNVALAFTRVLFFILSVFFMTFYMVSQPIGHHAFRVLIGIGTGVLFGAFLLLFDRIFRRYNLRSYNIAILGLFIGYLMGEALVLIFQGILTISLTLNLTPQIIEMVKIALFLFGIYFGTIMTLRAADEISISIPFIRFVSQTQKKRDLLVDLSALEDPRIIDLASSGLVDRHLIIPRFVIKEIYSQIETGDEMGKEKARHSLENLKKIEGFKEVELRIHELDFPDIKDLSTKFVRLSRLLDANILSSSITEVQIPLLEGIRIINLNNLSQSLKPLTEAGETMMIKIQRLGKEPRQGVGYLDDGTMVVVNGGGDFVGQVIEVQVLSVKHTTAGRIIFCNVLEKA